jgi:MYXO-CTERM domain-containing protein
MVVDLVNNQTGTAQGALFYRADFQSAGTGVIDPFVRVQHDNGPPNNGHSPRGEEQGYNTSGRPVQYDELTDPNYTHDLLFSQIPTVTIQGVPYKQFILDINEPNGGGQSLLSLDQVTIYTSTVGSQTGLESTLGVMRWSLSTTLDTPNVVTLDYNLNSGSGQGDMQMYVPLSNFAGVLDTDYVYLYSYFGHYMPSDFQTGDGFEEWAVMTPVPGPGVLGVLGVAALGASRRRRR